jgi:hypothetical protein
MSGINLKDKIKKVNQGIFDYVITLDKKLLPQPFIDELMINMDMNFVSTNALVNNENILKSIHKSNITSERLISLIQHKPECINYIEIKEFKFNKEDIIGLVIRHGYLLDYFDLDINSLGFNEIIMIYSRNQTIRDRIDFKKFNQTHLDAKNIVNNHLDKKHVIDILDFDKLDSNQMRLILKKYGQEYLSKFDLKKIKPNDWLDILKTHPEFIEYCNIESFKTGDYYYLAQLISFYLHLDHLVDENKENFNALSTEILIITSPDRFLNRVNTNKLKDKNWINIIKHHPYLRNRYYFG